ncbi:MAG TPA: HEPN domain-containing protein [Stellaceae bacterium]
MSAHPVPKELLDSIVAHFNPQRVILFGSQARGDAGPDSDIDLMVVVDDDTPTERLSGESVSKSRAGYRGTADILPWRASVFRTRAQARASLPATALREGITLYAREVEIGGEVSEYGPWQEARTWFRKAHEDLSLARLALPANLIDGAAFHVQQVLEKLLKGLLAAADQELFKSHEIEELAKLAHAHWPSAVGLPFPLNAVGKWYIGSRYPDVPGPSPDPEEVAEALEAVAALLDLAEAQEPADEP